MRFPFQTILPQCVVRAKTALKPFTTTTTTTNNNTGSHNAETCCSAAATLRITGPESPIKEKAFDGTPTENFKSRSNRLWPRHISVDVPLAQRLSHLSNEQTFLAWFSLSHAMASLGVVIAQISRIQKALDDEAEHNDATARRASGKPQACICQLSAILILLVGAWRFLQHQEDILRGLTKFYFGGVYLTGVVVLLCLVSFFVLLVTFLDGP